MWTDPYSNFESRTLLNKLTVYANHRPGCPWMVVGFLVYSGAEQDPVGREGLAHFVEHLVSENVDNSLKNDVKTFFEKNGGLVNLGQTNRLYTSYQFFLPSRQNILKEAFSIFGRMLLLAKIEKLIEREREVISSEFFRRYPDSYSIEMVMQKNRALHSGRCLLTLGIPETIRAITQSDLQLFYDNHYVPANISIIGIGGLNISELVNFVSESPFAVTKEGQRTAIPSLVADVGSPMESRYVFEISKHFSMMEGCQKTGAYQSTAKLPGSIKREALLIMEKMLREVLFCEIRERRGWAYEIGVLRGEFGGFYESVITCPGLKPSFLNDIEKVIDLCIVSLETRENLFNRIKECVLAGVSMVDLNGGELCCSVVKELARSRKISSLSEYESKINSVTMDDIRELVQMLRSEMRWTLLVTP